MSQSFNSQPFKTNYCIKYLGFISMSNYKNVFIYPLIERKFENIDIKKHDNKKEFFKICFHGHYPHLFKFEPFIKNAIEKFNKEVKKVKLVISVILCLFKSF